MKIRSTLLRVYLTEKDLHSRIDRNDFRSALQPAAEKIRLADNNIKSSEETGEEEAREHIERGAKYGCQVFESVSAFGASYPIYKFRYGTHEQEASSVVGEPGA